MSYKMRNLPCNIRPDHKLWCVMGAVDNGNGYYGGGVLEWCYDQADAEALVEEMQKDSRFSNLTASKYKEEP